MAYSFQTFTNSQVFTEGQANQIEVNIRDHVHGQNSVAPVHLNWTQQNKTSTFDVVAAMNGQFIRAGTSQTSNMVARLLDVASAGESFAFGVLNDNDLSLGVGSQGATGVVLVSSSTAQPMTKAGFRDWPVTPGEAGYFIQSSGAWYPYGFSGLHPVGRDRLDGSLGADLTVNISSGYDAYLILVEDAETPKSQLPLHLRTRRSGVSSGSYDDEFLDLGDAPSGGVYSTHCAMLFNVAKQDGADNPFAVLFCGYDGGTPTIETPLVTALVGSADTAPVAEVVVQVSGGNGLATGTLSVYGLRRFVT